MKTLNLLDTIAILNSVSIDRLTLVRARISISGLPSGQVGTIVEIYDNREENQYLVEFADNQGCEYAMAILKENEVLALHYELTIAPAP
ncbi:MAG: DUF4926 domain-containing protein [Coleofasciculaceae cyanobacterium SM2_1_6]|nr:DUF4926 domain-containing protein [Coleofasciculaceae cyanobacterium SM2_1_6]